MHKALIIICLLALLGINFIIPAQAQEDPGIMLTITPPLIKNGVNPGQVWQSAIKLVNNNNFKIDAYVEVADFKGGSGRGTVRFLEKPTGEADISHLLSEWIEIEPGPFVIAPQESRDIQFIIKVPETAAPGGHYAAILAGTKPPAGQTISGSSIKISSLLASLLLLNVAGEIKEEGAIREFSTDKKFYTEPEANFTVRFANQGNIHIQPQGEINIKNWFGKDKGAITINHQTEYGNVLPEEIRSWEYSWQGEDSLLEMGRYRAELILTYGEQAKQTVEQGLYFWVIQPKPLIIMGGSLLFLILLTIFFIRIYIKGAIKRTHDRMGVVLPAVQKNKKKISVIPDSNNHINAQSAIKHKTNLAKKTKSRWLNFRGFIVIIFSILIVLIGLGGYIYYLNHEPGKTVPAESGEKNIGEENINAIDINRGEQAVEIISSPIATTSEEKIATTALNIAAEGLEQEEAPVDNNKMDEELIIKVLNGSGQAGAATVGSKILTDADYLVSAVGNADNFNYPITLIRFKAKYEQEAEAIAGLFTAQVELEEVQLTEADIVIIIGANFE